MTVVVNREGDMKGLISQWEDNGKNTLLSNLVVCFSVCFIPKERYKETDHGRVPHNEYVDMLQKDRITLA